MVLICLYLPTKTEKERGRGLKYLFNDLKKRTPTQVLLKGETVRKVQDKRESFNNITEASRIHSRITAGSTAQYFPKQ